MGFFMKKRSDRPLFDIFGKFPLGKGLRIF